MTALVYSEQYKNHDTGNHVENERRVQVIMETVREMNLLESDDIFEPDMVEDEDLLRIHSSDHIEHIKAFCKKGGGYLDYDTIASAQSYETARLSAGGALKAAELVLDGYDNAYSIGRPPGHHANRYKAMGFCIFNNLAVTVEYLREVRKIKKFMILDFDVHYGNGTAEIFYEDPDVFYISIHQDPRTIFPGTGFISEIGRDEGKGANLNLPLPPGSDSSDYKYILERVLRPVAHKFDPDFYLVDVGFDGHKNDPLSSINLDDQFFEWIAVEMMDIADSITLILEGGYDLNALSRCNAKLINGLKNYQVLKDKRDKDDKKGSDTNSKVYDQTKNIFQELKEIYSPYVDF